MLRGIAATVVLVGLTLAAAPASCWAQAAAPGAASRPAAPETNGIPEANSPDSKTPESGGSTDNLSDKLDRSSGVIRPPGGVDPGIAQSPPPAGPRSTPVIPPPGGPGGPPGVVAK